MESFSQKITQEGLVKSEVSDDPFQTFSEKSDDESLSSPTPKDTSNSNDDKRDLSMDSSVNGSPLPPRKRAKTHEEKEQRRIERIMRNRQAAHASREKKRKHLETLESRCAQLESENLKMSQALAQQEELKVRVAQLESIIRLAKSSGNISALDSVAAVLPLEGRDSTTLSGTVSGSVAGSSSSSASSVSETETLGNSVSGSPAPSLEEDCASPDAFFLKNEDVLFPPNSPEKSFPDTSFEDPFGIMNFSFDSNPAPADNLTYSESLSKSRHPAALTHLSNDFANTPIDC